MAAVVDAFFVPSALQMKIGHIRPCLTPEDKLLVAVPSFRDGILPAIFGAFGILRYPFITLCLRCGRGHIHLLFAYFILVLLLPSVGLCLLELGGGKAPFLAVFDTEIFFLGLVLPFSLFIQRAHCQQDVGMGIVSGRIWVMDGSIGAHSVCYKLLLDEILQELNLFLPAQFYGQRRHKFTGEAAVLCGFGFLHGVPQGFPILPFCGGGGWQKNLPPPKPLFTGIVMLHPVILVEHPGTAQIGRSRHGGAPSSTADYFGLQMINRHCLPSFLKGYCETQQPFFRTRLQQVRREIRRTASRGGTNRSTPVSVPSCRWQVDAGRRRDGVAIYHPMNRGFQSGNPCADCMGKAGSLVEMQPCPAAPAGAAIPLGERTCPTNGRATTACFSRW